MKPNFQTVLPLVLQHEGGFVNHPDDPGGATNRGVTIGTLKRLGIDVDGDGDSDIADLKKLRDADVARVYRLFYWDAVRADLLPSGLDYAMFDFAVNSGPARAGQHLQRILGVEADGDVGPKTLAAVAKRDPAELVAALMASRLRFLKGLSHWKTFGKGWQRRVDDVRAAALKLAGTLPARPDAPAPPPPAASVPHDQPESLLAALWRALVGIITGKGA
jgi:lysozyme family protein